MYYISRNIHKLISKISLKRIGAIITAGAVMSGISITHFRSEYKVTPEIFSFVSGASDYEIKDEAKKNAAKKIIENKDYILYYAEMYNVDPRIIAGCIYVEQTKNYNTFDCADTEVSRWLGKDNSLGIGQVKISTAKYIENNKGLKLDDKVYYMFPNEIENEKLKNISDVLCCDYNFSNILFPILYDYYYYYTSLYNHNLIIEKLNQDSINIEYIAAYLNLLSNMWEDEFPEIRNNPAILGTLYNLGHEKIPHSDPQPNDFGLIVNNNMYLMNELLFEIGNKKL